MKHGTKCRRFTPEEDAELVRLRLLHRGTEPGRRPWGDKAKVGGLMTIARKMGRHKSSIQMRLKTLAGREDLWDF